MTEKHIVICEECGKINAYEHEGEAETYGWEFIEGEYCNYWLCFDCIYEAKQYGNS